MSKRVTCWNCHYLVWRGRLCRDCIRIAVIGAFAGAWPVIIAWLLSAK